MRRMDVGGLSGWNPTKLSVGVLVKITIFPSGTLAVQCAYLTRAGGDVLANLIRLC